MIQIDGLAEVVLNVRDARRAVAFYGNLLGLERLTPEGRPGPIFFRSSPTTSHDSDDQCGTLKVRAHGDPSVSLTQTDILPSSG